MLEAPNGWTNHRVGLHVRTVSLEPRMFPYRLEQVRDGCLPAWTRRLSKVVAMHDATIGGNEKAVPPRRLAVFGLRMTATGLPEVAICSTRCHRAYRRRSSACSRAGRLPHHSNLSVAKPLRARFSAAWDMNLSVSRPRPRLDAASGHYWWNATRWPKRWANRVSAGELAIDFDLQGHAADEYSRSVVERFVAVVVGRAGV